LVIGTTSYPCRLRNAFGFRIVGVMDIEAVSDMTPNFLGFYTKPTHKASHPASGKGRA
jgi:hypothetical protein